MPLKGGKEDTFNNDCADRERERERASSRTTSSNNIDETNTVTAIIEFDKIERQWKKNAPWSDKIDIKGLSRCIYCVHC